MGRGSRRNNLGGIGRKALAAALLATTVVAAGGEASPPAQAQAMTYSVPAGPLNRALAVFGSQSGTQISYEASIVRSKSSRGVDGAVTREQAIAQLLQGTGLSYSFTDATSVVISTPVSSGRTLPDDGSTRLETITIKGQQESAFGHVDGFVASRGSSGTKTDTPLIETPQTVNVITSDQIKAQNSKTLGESVQYTPGVVVQEGFNRTDDPFMIRGYDVRTNPGVMYRDGLKVPLPHYSVVAEPYGLERVEILKGPASVLYGQAAAGGVVNTISKRPTKETFREVNTTFGSNAHKQVSADAGGALDDEGVWSYRLTGLARDSGTMIDKIPDDRLYLAPSLTFAPSAETELTILGSFMRNETINNAGYPFSGTVAENPNGRISSDLFTGEPDWSKWQQNVGTIGYQFSHRFAETWKFQQNVIAGKSSTDIHHIYPWSWVAGSNQSLLERGAYTRQDDAWGVTIDNNLSTEFSTLGLEHGLLFGFDYTKASLERRQAAGYNNLAPLNPFDPVYGSPVVIPGALNTHTVEDRSQLGLYLQDQIKLDNWVLLLGGRYDIARQDTTNRLTGTVTEMDDTAFTGRVGLVYLFDNGLAPYASYSTSFQPQGGTDRFGNTFDPTTGEQLEAGIKYQPAGWNSFLTLSAFEITRQNLLTTDLANPAFNIQQGEVRSRGIEVSAVAELNDNWNLVASYTYTDAEVTRSNGADLGRVPAAVPEHMASLWLDYTVGSGPLEGLKAGGGIRYMGETRDTTNVYRVPDFTLVDAAISYDFGVKNEDLKGLSLSVSAKNLFDKDYVSSCTYACFYGDRRSVFGTLSYKW
ncbi:MAG: ligand-gated channel [Rhizobium sp. 63-7]|nr:MAG: ligand-gated channel [Rhizobium sp. 63-7]